MKNKRERRNFVVWVKEDGLWQENGDGPMSLKEAERVAREIKLDCKVRVVPVGQDVASVHGKYC